MFPTNELAGGAIPRRAEEEKAVMRIQGLMRSVSCLAMGIGLAVGIGVAAAAAQTAEVVSRVVDKVDDARLTRLTGNTPPMIAPSLERGRLDPATPMKKLILVLKRSPEQDAALAAFNEAQYDSKSPDYHHWLHAEEFGQLYGPADADIAAITGWLANHGFLVEEVGKGRTWIRFSGNAAQVEDAFHVEMHHYLVAGKDHISNDRDPQIPEALAPVVTGLLSLHNFFPMHQGWTGRQVHRDAATGRVTLAETDAELNARLGTEARPLPVTGGRAPEPVGGAGSGEAGDGNGGITLNPQYTYTDGSGLTREDLTPADFGMIYNITGLWTAATPVNGKGVTVSISGISDITLNDIAVYRSAFGLPATTVNIIQSDAATDPGNTSPGENTEDLEMVSAAAPGANLQMVVSNNTTTTFGDYLSDAYIIDKETAPIMSASYGFCELLLGTSGNAAYNTIWQQGATEGISIFESAGDQGAAGCMSQNGAAPNPSIYGLQVNGMASSPFVTAVGGTDLLWPYVEATDPPSTWWNTTNGTDGVTAKGYMPEIAWNTTCANPLLLNVFTNNGTPFANTEAFCNAAANSADYAGLVDISAGSGGVSACTTNSTAAFTPSTTTLTLTPSSCSGGYAKPSYQSALTPADGKRDLPDISMFASYGYGSVIGDIPGSAILVCITQSGSTCSATTMTENGGTSAASPFSAGVMAMILQQNKGLRQGLANPVFYKMAAAESTSACNTSTVAAGNSCYFYDITQGSNAQVCTPGDPNCTAITAGDKYAVLSGYSAETGYDEATGLGTMNVANIVNNWSKEAGAPAVTLSPTTMTFTSTAVGTASAAQTLTVKNGGTATLYITSIGLSGTNASAFTETVSGTGGCSSASVLAGASCTIAVTFKPVATGTSTATLTLTDSAGTGTQTVALSGSVAASAPAVTLSPTSLTFASTNIGATTAAQVVTVKNSGTAALTLTSETLTGTNASSFVISANTCGTSLAASATCAVSVEFKPAAAGALTASLSVADNATGSPQAATLSGTGVGVPAVTLSPTTLTFASTVEGATTAAQVVTVKNSGTAALTLTSETLTGTNASSFVISANTCGTSLAVSATCAVSVEFKPAAAGALTASLSVADNATGTPQTVALSGTGTAATATVTLSPTSLTFASTNEGSTTAAQLVTVKNSGTAALTLTSETITGTNATSFVKSATTCGTSLAAGASCTVSVEFKPLAAGALTASLSIADSATGSPQAVAMTGTGVAVPLVTLSPTSLAFASTNEGATTAAQLVTVKNSGTAALTLTSETIMGTSATSFLKSSTTCGTSLAVGASCTVSVEFKPLAVGALTASLSIGDNATGSPQAATLSGTGVAAPLVTLSPASLTFAATVVGSTTAAQLVTVKNAGTAALTLTSETVTGTNATSFIKSATTCGTSLAVGATCTVSVEMKPVALGALTASLAIADNATGSPQTVAITGTGSPAITLTPTSIAFPETVVGVTSDAQIVTVKNVSVAAVTMSSITLGGTNATSFQQIGTCGTSLAAGASCSVYVAFDPASAAALTGTLSVADSALGSPQKVTLTGTGTAAPSVKLSAISLTFPTTAPGTTSAAQAVTLTNSGAVTLTLTAITLTGTNPTDFEELNTCGATLAPAASCTVYLAFKPAAAAAYKATLSVADSGASSPQSVALAGTGS